MRNKNSKTKIKKTIHFATSSSSFSHNSISPYTGTAINQLQVQQENIDGVHLRRYKHVVQSMHSMLNEMELLLNVSVQLPKEYVYQIMRRFEDIMSTQLSLK